MAMMVVDEEALVGLQALKCPDLGRYTFQGWLAAGQPDLDCYLRESAWSAG
jgi:hypothetical protein